MPTQTTQEYLTKLTVPVLREMLKDFRAVGFSKSKKSELVATVALLMDSAHIDAIASAPVETPEDEFTVHGVKYTGSAATFLRGHYKRLNVYANQRNITVDSDFHFSKLTSAQQRRLRKKSDRDYKRLGIVNA